MTRADKELAPHVNDITVEEVKHALICIDRADEATIRNRRCDAGFRRPTIEQLAQYATDPSLLPVNIRAVAGAYYAKLESFQAQRLKQ